MHYTNLGPFGSAVLPFIGYKQAEKQSIYKNIIYKAIKVANIVVCCICICIYILYVGKVKMLSECFNMTKQL